MSRPHGPLYVGVTSNLVARIFQHRQGAAESFTSRYNLKRLVHYEMNESAETAIRREKRLKNWNRPWKLHLTGT